MPWKELLAKRDIEDEERSKGREERRRGIIAGCADAPVPVFKAVTRDLRRTGMYARHCLRLERY